MPLYRQPPYKTHTSDSTLLVLQELVSYISLNNAGLAHSSFSEQHLQGENTRNSISHYLILKQLCSINILVRSHSRFLLRMPTKMDLVQRPVPRLFPRIDPSFRLVETHPSALSSRFTPCWIGTRDLPYSFAQHKERWT